MSIILSVQDLQDIAVRCTSSFLTHQTQLNQSLAKEAADLNLNSEQLKRAVEAVNTLTYLKTLEKSAADGTRTEEFPVADYAEIVKIASIPQGLTIPQDTTDIIENPEMIFDKVAAFELDFPQLTQREQFLGIWKEAQINDRALEEAEVMADVLKDGLVKAARAIAKDEQCLDKLSVVLPDGEFEKIAYLVFGDLKVKTGAVPELFKEATLTEAKNLALLYKQAEQLLFEMAKRKELQKQADEYLHLQKEASFATSAAGAIGKGVGKVIGGIASAPVKGAKAMLGAGVKKVHNAVADTGLGKTMLMDHKAINPNVKRTVAGAGIVGGAALDASMYKPKMDPNSGEGGDVWKKLQS